jgi:hypothetical protein
MSINLQSNKIEGFDEIQDGLFYLLGESGVSITQLMNNKFIMENTDFDSWENLLVEAGVKNEKDFEKPNFNEFIKLHTRFDDWEFMLIEASNDYSLQYKDR